MTGNDRAVTKDEVDVERHFLKQTIHLSDGTEGIIFSRGTKNEANLFLYSCHLCGVPNLPGERCLQTHISGRKHQTKLLQPVVDALSFRAPLVAKPKIQMNIAPGEPVPPGFEDEVKPMASIQPFINKHKDSSIIGIEYCIELIDRDEDKEPNYICLLCDKRGDQRTIFSHWSSYNHRLKYLEKHFPSIIKELVPFRYNPEARNIMPRLIQSVVEAIEEHHGRLSPTVCDINDFKRKRNILLQEIIADKHFDEKTGPNFINSIDRSLAEDPNKKKHKEPSPPNVKAPVKRKPVDSRNRKNSLDSISSDSDTSLNNFKDKNNKNTGPVKRKKSQSPAYRIVGRVQRSPPFGESKPEPKKKTLPTPKELSAQASEIAQERYKWEKYRCMLEIAVEELEKILKNYEKNPEKHPLYPEEWKQFWNRRYKELQAEKKDPNKYDFKPEWVVFWTKRMRELHLEEVERKKIEIRKKLDLPEDGVERTDELKEQYKVKLDPKSKSTAGPSKSFSSSKSKPIDTIDISDEEDEEHYSSSRTKPKRSGRSGSRSRSRSYSRSNSPYSDYERRSRSKKSRFSRESRERDYRRLSISPPPASSILERIPRFGPHPGEYFHPRPPHYFQPRNYGPRPYYGPAPYGPPVTYRDPYRYVKYERKSQSPSKEKSPEPEDEGPLTVVAVLRLLTALEDHLGSLGPKVVDLLSKALALEKVKANSADDMLINEDHCVFFETVKEKLKGQLIAEVLDANKIKTVKKAIKNIAAIVHQVNERTEKRAVEENSQDTTLKVDDSKTKSKKIAASKELPFDRQIISSKLAAALVLQNRTDITRDEMDKLIHVLILLVKISKEREQVVKIEDVLVELGVISPVSEEVMIENDDNNFEEPQGVIAADHEEDREEDEEDTTAQSGVGDLESLTDSDLQTLLQNFKHLSSEEQQHLIVHLKKLEVKNPARVEKLRKYVNISELKNTEGNHNVKKTLSIKLTGTKQQKENLLPVKPLNMFEDDDDEPNDPKQNKDKKNSDKPQRNKIIDSDDDDDYNFDDVVKAASKNVHHSELSNRGDSLTRSDSLLRDRDGDISNMSKGSSAASTSTANLGISLADTQNLIANLMGSLQKNSGKNFNKHSNNSHSENSNNANNNNSQNISMVGTNQNMPVSTSVPYYQQQSHQLQPQMQDQANYQQNPYNQQLYYQNQQGYENNFNNGQQQMPYSQFSDFGHASSMQQQYTQQQQQQQQQQYNNYQNYNMNPAWQQPRQ